MKKFMSLALALVMSLALVLPAFAMEENFQTENSALVPTIEVEMPASAGVILNPYGMTYTGGILGADTNTSTAQIISNSFAITNKTQGVNLEVQAKVTGVASGNAQLVKTDDANLENDTSNTAVATVGKKFKSDETANKVCLALSYNFTGTGKTAAAAPTLGTENAFTKSADYVKIITDSEEDLTTIVLPPSNGTNHSYVVYKFSGIAVSKPETPWGESDTVGATFVYTFTATPDAVTAA